MVSNTTTSQFSTSVRKKRVKVPEDKDNSVSESSIQSSEDPELRKGLEAIIEQQKAFEERMTRKLEETVQNSQAIEKQIQELKKKEIEMQIELLKRGNDEIMKRNFELEAELEKVRRSYRRHESGKTSMNSVHSMINAMQGTNPPQNSKVSTDSANVRHIPINFPARTDAQGSHRSGQHHSTLNGTLSSFQNAQAASDMKDSQTSTHSAARKKLSIKQNNEAYDPSLNNSNLENELEGQPNPMDGQFRKELRGLSIKSQPDQMSYAPSLTELRDALSSPSKKQSGKYKFNLELSLIESQNDVEDKPSADNTRKFENSSPLYRDKKRNPVQHVVKTHENDAQKNPDRELGNSGLSSKQDGNSKEMNQLAESGKFPLENISQTETLQMGNGNRAETNENPSTQTDPGSPDKREKRLKMEINREGSGRTLLKHQTFGLVEPTAHHFHHEANKPQNPPITRKETPQLEPLEKSASNSRADFGKNSPTKKENGSKILDFPLVLKEVKDESDATSERNKSGVSPVTFEPLNAASLLESPDYLSYPKQSVICKQTSLSDSNRYLTELRLQSQGNDRNLVLLLKESPPDKEEFKVVAHESIRFRELQKILNHLDCRDSLPSIVTLKSIRTYSAFIKHIIMPFVGVTGRFSNVVFNSYI